MKEPIGFIGLGNMGKPMAIHLLNAGYPLIVFDTREELLETIDDLRANSIDYYATLRSVYAQRRAALVRDDDPSTAAASADFSNY